MKVLAIVVAKQRKVNPEIAMNVSHCSSCAKDFVANATIGEPFCPHCGSEETAMVNSETASVAGKKLLATSDKELATLKCRGCSNHIILPADTAMAIASVEGVGKIHCAMCGEANSFKAAKPAKKQKTEEANAPVTEYQVNLASTLKGEYTFMRSDLNKVIACIDGVPVAVHESPDTETAKSLVATLMQNCEQADFQLGADFTPICAPITVDSLVNQRMEQCNQDSQQQLQNALAALGERYAQALSIVWLGQNRGMFPGATAFVETLATAMADNGVDEATIASVMDSFATNSDTIATEIHELASSLAQDSDEVRNRMAETAANMKPTKIEVASVQDPLSSALSAPMRGSKKQVQEAEVASTKSESKIKTLASKSPLFGKHFN